MMRSAVLISVTLLAAVAEQSVPPTLDFTCPMDPDVRSARPGKCPRCGMPLEARIQEPVDYRLRLTTSPANAPAGKPLELSFELLDPLTSRRATKFEVVHEKFFHLFLVSADLNYFVHDHPVLGSDGIFRFRTSLPQPGIYRLLADCYPTGGTPQLLPAFITTSGYDKSITDSIGQPAPDLQSKTSENLTVSLTLDPPQPIPGKKTMLFFKLDPADGIEPYLGAWGHLLAASADLIDTIHEHPIYADGGPAVQFNVFFPRAGIYRVWVQFQRKGVVNTAAFTIPVNPLQ